MISTRMLNPNPLLAIALLLLGAQTVQAQSTAFTYQGKLSITSTPATGNFDMQFKLFDALSDGQQIGATVANPAVAVANGIFSVELNFGAGAFDGTPRFLEICLRPMGNPDPYTVLAPRQPITATPYSMRSAKASAADGLSTACVGCVVNSHIEAIDGAKITGTVAGSQISGEIPTASVPDGSGNYIQNAAAALRLGKNSIQQEGGFNIDGDGVVGGTLSGSIVNAQSQFNLAGNRILSNAGSNNLFVGSQAGAANTAGSSNAFFGYRAGGSNTTGGANAFFGAAAGNANTIGNFNAFFGEGAGFSNTIGSLNSFFGDNAGGSNTTGNLNSFFGYLAGAANTAGSSNAFFGSNAGRLTTGGSSNAFFGEGAGFSNTVGSDNAFFGVEAGKANISGTHNSFFGHLAGSNTNLGNNNAFFGWGAGGSNFTGSSNTLMGVFADVGSGNLDHASAIGAGAIVTASNTVQIGRIGIDKVAIGAFSPSTFKPVCINGQGVLAGCAQIANPICINSDGDFIACASSLRYKSNIHTFAHGMALLRKLRPVAYTWKEDGRADVGLIAEEVAKVEPRLTIYNQKGEIEGVKYPQLTVVLINAVKEQQAQIEKQQAQIEHSRKQFAAQQAQITEQGSKLARQQRDLDALKQLLCHAHPRAPVCKAARRKT